jgi:ribosomal protein S18 acetylase RimI-like enzyme
MNAPAAVTIRPARLEDAGALHEALLKLGRHLGAAHRITATADDLRRFGFGGTPAFEALVAEAEGTVCGIAIFFPIFSTWRGCPGVYVQDLFVEAHMRGQGVGERLLRHVAAISRGRGGGYLRLAVDANNLSAQAFYDRLGIGWVREDREHAIFGDAFIEFAARRGDEP